MLLVLSGLVGCVSPYHAPDGSYLVTKHSEVRSPFGTNGGFDFLEKCQGPETVVLFYFESDFTHCERVVPDDRTAFHKASQGQGGQILEGAMNAGALGALAATKAGASATASAGAVAIQSTTVTVGKGGKR